MSGYAVHAQAWGDVRPEGTATTQASVPAALWKVAKVATSVVDVAELVGSLLAAPVTEPASVAELREAAATHLAAQRGEADEESAAREAVVTERDEARAQLDALREAAERATSTGGVVWADRVEVSHEALRSLVAVLADTAGAARERAERQAERERAIAVAVRDACSRRVTLGCGTCNAVGSVTYEDMQEDDSEECEACEGTGHAQHADIHAIDLDEIVASVRGRA